MRIRNLYIFRIRPFLTQLRSLWNTGIGNSFKLNKFIFDDLHIYFEKFKSLANSNSFV